MLTKIRRDKYVHEHHAYETKATTTKNAGYVNVGEPFSNKSGDI